jgi:hypothetical protein
MNQSKQDLGVCVIPAAGLRLSPGLQCTCLLVCLWGAASCRIYVPCLSTHMCGCLVLGSISPCNITNDDFTIASSTYRTHCARSHMPGNMAHALAVLTSMHEDRVGGKCVGVGVDMVPSRLSPAFLCAQMLSAECKCCTCRVCFAVVLQLNCASASYGACLCALHV